jgi:NAD-dependent dihydropyrimidine dehydrogenase PreA subunit
VAESAESLSAVCKEPGKLVPVIDQNRCEGKQDCVRVCPYHVFEMTVLNAQDKAKLSVRGRLKAFFHGGRQAFVRNPDACHACGLCVQACPERAIKLAAAPSKNG